MSTSDSDTESLDGLAEVGWEEWENDEEENDATKSLFSNTVLPSPEAAFKYDATHHSFDLRQYKIEKRLDDYDVIKVINYIRHEVAQGRDPVPALVAAAIGGSSSSGTAAPWSNDNFLTPVLENDPLLTYDYDEQQGPSSAGPSEDDTAAAMAALAAARVAVTAGPSSSSSCCSSHQVTQLVLQMQALLAENHELKLRVAALMDAALPPDVQEEMLSEAIVVPTRQPAAGGGAAAAGHPVDELASSSSSNQQVAADATEHASNSVSNVRMQHLAAAGAGGASATARHVDTLYFDSYSSFDIHHEMLSDKPRTQAYQQALTQNPSLLSGATVLDVGCGTGILSLFAATGGAAAVVGLDGNERIAGFAREVIAANGLDAASGGPVIIVSGKVEEVQDIGHKQVSVIVSEWMGYALLFESMLDSVLAARDRWLAPGGAVLPDKAAIHVAGADSRALGTAFWQNVYGFSMHPIANEVASLASRESKVLVRPVEQEALNTDTVQVHSMDLVSMTQYQQDFTAQFELTFNSSRSSSNACTSDVAALVLWFDVEFSERFCKECPVTLSTSPLSEVTHWAQAVLPLPQAVRLQHHGDKLACRLSMARSRSKHRTLDMSLEYGVSSSSSSGDAQAAPKQMAVYTMDVSGGDG